MSSAPVEVISCFRQLIQIVVFLDFPQQSLQCNPPFTVRFDASDFQPNNSSFHALNVPFLDRKAAILPKGCEVCTMTYLNPSCLEGFVPPNRRKFSVLVTLSFQKIQKTLFYMCKAEKRCFPFSSHFIKKLILSHKTLKQHVYVSSNAERIQKMIMIGNRMRFVQELNISRTPFHLHASMHSLFAKSL